MAKNYDVRHYLFGYLIILRRFMLPNSIRKTNEIQQKDIIVKKFVSINFENKL